VLCLICMSPERKLRYSVPDELVDFVGELIVHTYSPGWSQRAACKGVDPEIFFPVTEEDSDIALSICADCRVRNDCLKYAIEHRQNEGVWGGYTENYRAELLKRLRSK